MNRLITEHASLVAVPSAPAAVTLEELAAAWLHHVEHVDGIKPWTLKSYRYMLGAPGDRARKRGCRRGGARVMREFGGQAIDSITTTQVERRLETLDAEDISKRTVNTYRQLVCSVLAHAARRPERYGIATNVARLTPKRREPDPGVLDFYEPEEVAALARAARAGAHRDPTRPSVSQAEVDERRRADDQGAALFIVAAFTGLRMGELLELRWRRVSFERASVTVAASWSAGAVTVPKSRKPLHRASRDASGRRARAPRRSQLAARPARARAQRPRTRLLVAHSRSEVSLGDARTATANRRLIE